MKPALPWFLPLSLVLGGAGTRAFLILRRERRPWTEGWALLALAWYPLLIWILNLCLHLE